MADDVKDAEDKLLARLPTDGKESIYNIWRFTNSIEKAWTPLDAALTASNPSNNVIEIQKELGRLIKQGTNFSGGKVTSQQVRDEIKKLDDAREADRQAKLQEINNTKPKEPTPEEKAKFLNSIKSPWDTAKDLARALGGNNGAKVFDSLSADVKEKLTLGDIVDGDAARNLFAGKVPINTSAKWASIYADKGPNGQKRSLDDFAQKIKDMALVLQENPGLINDIRTAMGKAPVQAAPGGVTGGNEKPAPGTPAAPTAAAQQLAAENAQLKQALEQETAAMNDMKAAMDKIGPQLQADQVTIRNLAIDKNALVHGLDSTEAAIGLNDAIHMTKHRGFLYHINPIHIFTRDNPMKNRGFIALTTAAQAQGGQDPNFMRYAVEMYNTKGSGPEKPAIIGMATTLDDNPNLFVGVSGVLAARQAAAVRQGSHDKAAQQLSANGGQQNFNSEQGVGAAPTSSAQWQQQPALNARVAPNGPAAAPQQAATSQPAPAGQPQNQPANAPAPV